MNATRSHNRSGSSRWKPASKVSMDDLAADNVYGPFWDPAGTFRSEIRTALAAKTGDALWIASVERIGRQFDEENRRGTA